ncbi:putative glutamate synthase [NADPH] [Smittium mucronatum]|uniref:glutamate synthase (NADH) n=1 Tax=Smittium mucronatum TaxID=133383 RepID=A0A1R0GQE2_9FUNG|nr:putative glutamate synthase [NADPH] [Smittium mucronatum]
MVTSWASSLPEKQGLYDPEYEKDSCGVGFVININGKKTNKVVNDALELLKNMEHRGAVGHDPLDGDGAGIMTSIPLKFLANVFSNCLEMETTGNLKRSGSKSDYRIIIRKNDSSEYNLKATSRDFVATGNIFVNKDETYLGFLKTHFENVAKNVGLNVLGWRVVPTCNKYLGKVSKSNEPLILQPLISIHFDENNNREISLDLDIFERKLFFLRKVSTNEIFGKKDLDPKGCFFICSLSCKKIVYKGLVIPRYLAHYYPDLKNESFQAHFAMVHSRFSTNTFPSWDRAQPFRMCAHNGEINSLRGNKNRMLSRESMLKSDHFTRDQINLLLPIIENRGSDSQAFDNTLELLLLGGSMPIYEVMMLMIPEAWQNSDESKMSKEDSNKRSFYEWASSIMEPWDGPALITFSDGRYCGATLDRNGLRPCRYYITHDGLMICASEVGPIKIESENVKHKGRLMPGKMLLVDTEKGILINDTKLKQNVCTKFPFGEWIKNSSLDLDAIISEKRGRINQLMKDDENTNDQLNGLNDSRLEAFGYSREEINVIMLPMLRDGKEALGSMGNDSILACLDSGPRSPFDYMRQLFAQVTNPPIDPIRESIIMSLECMIGPEKNPLKVEESQVKRIKLKSFLLDKTRFFTLCNLDEIMFKEKHNTGLDIENPDEIGWKVGFIEMVFQKDKGIKEFRNRIEEICEEAINHVMNGCKILILTDRKMDNQWVSIFCLLASGAVHNSLVKSKLRLKVALIVETGEVRNVHQCCTLISYGVDAIYPYMVYKLIPTLKKMNIIDNELDENKMAIMYTKSVENGFKKVISKMGISTLHSYKGAQIFEALGISQEVIDLCLTNTSSRIGGSTFEVFACDAISMHENGYKFSIDPNNKLFYGKESMLDSLGSVGEFHWNNGGVKHLNTPASIGHLQNAVRQKNQKSWDSYTKEQWNNTKNLTLRGLLEIKKIESQYQIDLDLVEPWTEIVKRFCTGAMSYGSISIEAHTSLAAAMNRIGGKSNTGEGGEDSERYKRLPNNDLHRSAIKQVASGRFGVTSHYLCNSDELQIKMAQGAKPGEGGELPGHKVSKEIAKTRHSTVGVGLISPPPHHDIYSIEDLKQLIHDLRGANPRSRISVKLVSTVGVGVVASGVAKANANHILISGHDGGTGASRWTGIKHAGTPWEIGLAETHQTLSLNNLREKVIIQTDGQLKTGKDVVIAGLLGADEFGFATTPLIALGCTMMRKCHLNTCPVGIATQDPILRERFKGKPEHVINYFYYLAEDIRKLMARLGIQKFQDLVGRRDLLIMDTDNESRSIKAKNIDLIKLISKTPNQKERIERTDYYDEVKDRLEVRIFESIRDQMKKGEKITLNSEINNTDRSFGSTISYFTSLYHGESGMASETVEIKLKGSAGQSFGAFLAKGISIELEGDCNDYAGKGLSGGKIVIYSPKDSTFDSDKNIIAGNVCLYGATSGEAYFGGVAAERFAVRNSGAKAVIEGVGDHGCEYMTGGIVVILGKTGKNFGAGMSGGVAYVYTENFEVFKSNCNLEMVELKKMTLKDSKEVHKLIENHCKFCNSKISYRILTNWDVESSKFIKVISPEYEKILQEKIPRIPSKDKVDKKLNEMDDKLSNIVDLEDSVPNGDAIRTSEKREYKLRGFMRQKRETEIYRDPKKRINDWNEINSRFPKNKLIAQASRCMDCGIPFCQSDYSGCPIGNKIPKWNDLIFSGDWKSAFESLMSTNNFPEFTGRVCPAPCEGACVLGINSAPVNIKSIEAAIIDHAWKQGWMSPNIPSNRTGKKVAIIGSGPAGLAAADQLNFAGHSVVIFEKEDRVGGLLTYGIPNMKLDKMLVNRRVSKMAEEGIEFRVNSEVGKNVSTDRVLSDYDAVLISTGSTWPRDLKIEGRDLDGIYFAVDFLKKNTKSLLDSKLKDELYISAKGKDVIVIGGGDTGTDCVATSIRHLANSVVNFEVMPKPPNERSSENPWPLYPRTFKVDYGHAEAISTFGEDPRVYCISSKKFVGNSKNQVMGIETVRVEWNKNEDGGWKLDEVDNTKKIFKADLVLIAMGFLGPEKGLLSEMGINLDSRGNIKTSEGSYRTNVPKVFAAGDCRRGQSLVVWGINEGRQSAREIDEYLMGLGPVYSEVSESNLIKNSTLPVCGGVIQRPIELKELNK